WEWEVLLGWECWGLEKDWGGGEKAARLLSGDACRFPNAGPPSATRLTAPLHRRVRSRRRTGERVLGDHVDEVVAELGEVGGLPVVVPTMDDGRVERWNPTYGAGPMRSRRGVRDARS